MVSFRSYRSSSILDQRTPCSKTNMLLFKNKGQRSLLNTSCQPPWFAVASMHDSAPVFVHPCTHFCMNSLVRNDFENQVIEQRELLSNLQGWVVFKRFSLTFLHGLKTQEPTQTMTKTGVQMTVREELADSFCSPHHLCDLFNGGLTVSRILLSESPAQRFV